MRFQVTVRHGGRYQHYHTLTVEAADAREALRLAASEIPDQVAAGADLVELRIAPDPDARSYVGEGG
jgi:hypothetical protein